MHLHGQPFYIMALGKAGDGPWKASIPLNFVNPIMRDTMTVAAGSYAVLLFKANYPGLWMFHCHM